MLLYCQTRNCSKTQIHRKLHQRDTVFRQIGSDAQVSGSILESYKSRVPTAKTLINALICNPKSDPERAVFSYLTRFIESLSMYDLRIFLQLLTTNDLTPTPITVDFGEQMFRASVVRKCSNTITLSPAYAFYNELTEEITSILRYKDSFSIHFV